MMRVLTDASEIERRGHDLLARAGDFASAGGIAGTGFEAYARILHPVRIDRPGSVIGTDGSSHCSWSQVAAVTGRRIHRHVQWPGLVSDPESGRWNRFTEQLQDGSRVTITEGVFAPDDMAALLPALERFTTTADRVVAAIWNGWGQTQFAESGPHFAWPARPMVLIETSLSELSNPDYGFHWGIGWERGSREPTPNMLWPDDLRWVVATEIDWSWTIVAGERSLIDVILADDRFETFEVGADDPLTWESDVVNPRPA